MEIQKIILKKNEEDRLLKGETWVYSNEVLNFEGPINSGQLCEVLTSDHKVIGYGFLNTASKIIVRLLSLTPITIDQTFFQKRIEAANSFRKSLGLDNNYRVVFSEADGLPGLIVDKYDQYLSMQILTLGMANHKDLIIKALVTIFHPLAIVERSDQPIRKKEGLEEFKGVVYGKLNDVVTIVENDVKIKVDLLNGQKTGYFLDQKFNRANLKNYVSNKTVLDCFSHTGGFALHAAGYNAKKVVAIDISQKACDDILTNAKLNNFTNIEVVCDDVFNYLRNNQDKHFDIIILDPPAFTKDRKTINQAYKGYKEINLSALKMLDSGGILFTFSCSMHMQPALFLQMLKDASIDAHKEVQLIDFRIQSPDHPTKLTDGDSLYLKCAVLRVL